MADEWLSDAMLDELPVSARLRVSAAAREDLALLTELVKDGNPTPDVVHLEDRQALAVLPGFRSSDLPDRLFRMAPIGVGGRLSALARTRSVTVEGGRLLVQVVLPVVGPDAEAAFSARVEPVGAASAPSAAAPAAAPAAASGPAGSSAAGSGTPGLSATASTQVGERSVTTVAVDLAALAAAGDGPCRLTLTGAIEAGPFDVRVPAPKDEFVSRFWHHARPHRVYVSKAVKGKDLEVRVEPVPPREVASAVVRRVRRPGP